MTGMPRQPLPEKIGFADASDHARARALFAAADYTDSGIARRLELDKMVMPNPLDAEAWTARTSEGTPLDGLIRFWILGRPLDRAAAGRLLGTIELRSWLDANLVVESDGSIWPRVSFFPFQDLLLASDRSMDEWVRTRPEFVMGMGGSTRTIIQATIRRHSRRTLDLGTGCGSMALLAARHSDQVVALDLNPRAVEYTRFNAALNGIPNIDARVGDLFEPVRGETFDLIVSNPPFVISPGMKSIFRDGGMPGDGFCQNLFRQLGAYLNPGGFAQVLFNWIEPADADWGERLASWFEPTACDTWILRTDSADPIRYALTWIRGTESHDPVAATASFTEWVEYLRAEKIARVGMGLATLRRRADQGGWVRIVTVPETMAPDAGQDIERGFHVLDFLERRGESALLDEVITVSPDTLLLRTHEVKDGAWQVSLQELIKARGLKYKGACDPIVADVLARCGGSATLRAVLDQTAREWELDLDDLTRHGLPVLRRLLELGLLRLESGTAHPTRAATQPSN